jgi:hypothetical protein
MAARVAAILVWAFASLMPRHRAGQNGFTTD